MGWEGTPTELWNCCRTYLICRCQNQICKQKKSWLKYCNTCKYNADICDRQICNRWDNKSASFSDMGLVIAAIIDILLTVFLVAAICMIEIKKRRPGNLPSDSASELSKSVKVNFKEIVAKNIKNRAIKSLKLQPKFMIKSVQKMSPRIKLETNLIKKSPKTISKSPEMPKSKQINLPNLHE